MPEEKVYPTSIRLPETLKKKLEMLAKEDRRSLSNYIIGILIDHVEKAEKSESK